MLHPCAYPAAAGAAVQALPLGPLKRSAFISLVQAAVKAVRKALHACMWWRIVCLHPDVQSCPACRITWWQLAVAGTANE